MSGAPAGRSRRRISVVAPAATSSWYHSETFVPVWSGLTVGGAVDDVIVDAVLRVGGARCGAEHAAVVRLVVAEQRDGIGAVGARQGDQLHRADDRMIDRHDAVVAQRRASA